MTLLEPNSAGIMAPLAIGAAITGLVFAGAHISGGHYNPAVSFAVFLRGKLSGKDLGKYAIAQIIAGAIAGYLTIYYKGYPIQPPFHLDTMKAFLAEFLFTFALCHVALNVAMAKGTQGNSFYGWAIGCIVFCRGLCCRICFGRSF